MRDAAAKAAGRFLVTFGPSALQEGGVLQEEASGAVPAVVASLAVLLADEAGDVRRKALSSVKAFAKLFKVRGRMGSRG